MLKVSLIVFPLRNRDLAVHQHGKEPVAKLGEVLVFLGVGGYLFIAAFNNTLKMTQDFFSGLNYWAVIDLIVCEIVNIGPKALIFYVCLEPI